MNLDVEALAKLGTRWSMSTTLSIMSESSMDTCSVCSVLTQTLNSVQISARDRAHRHLYLVISQMTVLHNDYFAIY